jgi:hypothetical protein
MQIADTLRQLEAAPIEFSAADACFVLPGVGRKRGLTKILGSLMPVPHGEPEPDEPEPKRCRRSKSDPVPAPTIWTHTANPTHRKWIKRAAASCRDATSACSLERFDEAEGRAGIGRAYNTRHGSLVDEQLKLRVASGRAALLDRTLGAMRGGIDPCTATLLDYLESRGQRIVAAQVPLYSAEMDVATAIDFLVDDGTLYEVKSSTVVDIEAIKRSNRSYELPRARLTRTALRGTPCSLYSLHQVQLYVMCAMMREMTGAEPPAAAVLRVSPGVVRDYRLNPWFKERADRFRRAIAQRTGQHKRNLKKKAHTRVLKPATIGKKR